MAVRAKHCNSCGMRFRPNEPTRFDTLDKDAIYHDGCFWDIARRRGWSYLKQPDAVHPLGLRFPCHGCGVEIYTAEESVWYERDAGLGGYRPYHPTCSPSKLDSES